MCMNVDVDVSWIASALGGIGFSTTIGLAMTVGRCVANWMSTTVEMSLRGLRQMNYDVAQVRSNPVIFITHTSMLIEHPMSILLKPMIPAFIEGCSRCSRVL
ncbi:MAG: hypothetical protein FWC76_04440 [Defluviitaleaceae bacterium]|nr:hypothetical protein [Defluviitaleaceae bacterium]